MKNESEMIENAFQGSISGQTPAETSPQSSSQHPVIFHPKQRVQLIGLQSNIGKTLNGLFGNIVEETEKDEYTVKLEDGRTYLVKHSNLNLVSDKAQPNRSKSESVAPPIIRIPSTDKKSSQNESEQQQESPQPKPNQKQQQIEDEGAYSYFDS